MGIIAGNLIAKLLERSQSIHFLHVQDGVTLSGDFLSGGENLMGRLLILQQEPQPSEEKRLRKSITSTLSTSAEEHTPIEGETEPNEVAEEGKREQSDGSFFVWAPYTYLAVHFPYLLPPRFSGLIDATVSKDDKKTWRYLTCAGVKNISRVQRRSSPCGVPVITLTFLDGTSMHPIIFREGGITKFLEALKKITPMRQSPFPDDFVVYGDYDAIVTKADAAAAESTNKTKEDHDDSSNLTTPRSSNGNNNKRSLFSEDVGREELQRVLYGSSELSNGARFRESLNLTVARVRTLIQGFTDQHNNSISSNNSPSLQCLKSNSNNNNNSHHNSHNKDNSGGNNGNGQENPLMDEAFDLLEELIPIEQQVPRIPEPQNRSMVPPLTAAEWECCFNGEDGKLDVNRYAEAKLIAYMGGVEPQIRLQVWCFMLHVYPDVQNSTETQREEIRKKYSQMYKQLTIQWTNIFPEQESHFSAFREIRSSIEKDVVRTDRIHSAYAENDSHKLSMLRHVLMAYALFNFDLGYCQGMSDVLSPIILLAETEVEAFMCFRCFIEEHCGNNFRHDVRVGMEVQFRALRALIRFFVPRLFTHLVSQHADDMGFCFRWLLMLFKREFPIDDAMLLWDVVISCPYTPHFELFVAAALLKAITPQILEQHLTYDELLKFANSTAGNINVHHLILLAQEFYDYVATHVIALDSPGTTIENYRPTLDDILKVLEGSCN
ncbi:Small G protein signaling modulator 1/2 [Trypanosoma melophagium]|uniref:Small G protein signaling modulator 1/2 n=1 Tax=Trypanosoma melophagium TaxID=715481 RepID=UPI00351A4268|nr:Small G protein signaling modulator 1/2 [Trypanosoma melophagium]